MTDIDTVLMEQIFHVTERKWKANIHHHSEAYNLRRSLEITEWILHLSTLRNAQCWFKPFFSDNATMRRANRAQAISSDRAIHPLIKERKAIRHSY